MKPIILNEDFTIKHVLVPGVHMIPDDAVMVSDAVVNELLNNPQTKAYIGGKVVHYSAPFNFEFAFEQKNSEIRKAFSQAMNPITSTYTAEDIASFPTQEAEAKAWDANNSAPTPLLDFMLANRPTVDKETLVTRILGNSVAYKQIAGPAIGKKQYLEDQLYALKAQHEDPEQPVVIQADFDDIVVDFS